ncbi:laccase-11-like [Contarinia nasturtii]|uniref:laccase-11-like n=1 Tax=Contarinia nasturtii TaxID=265458 RepID=UPI0012D49109|nr:laccase-11-like [Contarinia nasturtii]
MHFCPHLIQLKLGEVVDFLLSDVTYELEDIHSFHFHGYGFQIIDMGTLEQYKTNTTSYYNDTHPPTVKDTIGVPIGGFVRIRFRASNPGYWMRLIVRHEINCTSRR